MKSLKVQSNDPEKSAVIANKVASVFKTKIKNIMSINNVTIVSKATENTNKTSPNTKLFVMAGLVIGLLVSVFYAFAIELTDTTIKDDEFMTETLGLTNLGAIAQIKGDYHKNNLRNDRKKSDHRRVRV